jgi:hypothetical protein
MFPILALAAAFAAIIVVGTVAAWLHDTVAARLGARTGTRAHGLHEARRAGLAAPRTRAATGPDAARTRVRPHRRGRRSGATPVARHAAPRAGVPLAPARPVLVRTRPLP